VYLRTVVLIEFMVFTSFDRCRAKDIVETSAVRLLISPGTHGGKHVAVDFNGFVACCGVVEGTQDIVHDFAGGDSWVLPSVDNAAGNCK
jgi:hypothetical protein